MASTYQAAVEQTIAAGEQIHQIINGTATTEVIVEDGSKVPSIRKALVDNFYFKDPIVWQSGSSEVVFNQLRQFTDGSWWYAPSATTNNPVSMNSTPIGDPLWKLYTMDAVGELTPQIREALRRSYSSSGLSLQYSFQSGGTLTSETDVLLDEESGKAYSGAGPFPQSVPAGTNPIFGGLFTDRSNSPIAAGSVHFSHDIQYAAATVGYRLKNSVYADDAPFLADTTGAADAAGAINDALAFVPFGWTVLLKPGRYKLLSRVTIPNFKRLLGLGWCLDPSNTALYGVVLSVEWGEGQNEHAVEVNHSSALEGVMFYYPNQVAKTASTPVEYGFSISTPVVSGLYDNIRLRNITLYNSYRGVRLNNAGRWDVDTIIGDPLKVGFTADNCLDVCYMNHIHFWNFYTQSAALELWVSENGTAFDLRRIDQLFGSKLFAWNYYEAFGLGDGLWANLTDIACDKAFIPVRVEAVGHVQVNGFTLIGNAKARPAIWGRSGGSAKFSNGRITDTCSVGAQIDDGELYTFDNVQFDSPHASVVNTSTTSDVRISDTCKWKIPPLGQYNTMVNGERLNGRSTEITLPAPWISPTAISGGYSFDLSTVGTKQLAYETTYISQRNSLYVLQFDYELVGNPTTFYFQISIKNDVGGEIQFAITPAYPMILNGGTRTVFIPFFINHGRFKQSIFVDAVVTAPTVGASLRMTDIRLWEQDNKLTTNAQISNLMRMGYNLDAFSMGQTLESKGRNRRVYTNPEAGIGRPTIVPTQGDWLAGDEIVASTPVAGQPYRVRCSVSGTPGVWVTLETA